MLKFGDFSLESGILIASSVFGRYIYTFRANQQIVAQCEVNHENSCYCVRGGGGTFEAGHKCY